MDTIKFKNKEYDVFEKLKNNKLHVKRKNKDFIIVPFDTYINFSTYITNKKNIKSNKVEMSKILKKDKKALLILEQYIDGKDVIELVANNEMNKHFPELFRVFRNNRFAKIALSYKPENFVLKGKYFYYIADEITNYNQTKSFERTSDLLLWMNTKESKDYILKHRYSYKERNLYKNENELNKAIALLCVSNW